MTGLVWFTRDLRVHDHPALRAALDRCERVVPVFCFDDRLLRGRHASGPRTQFMLDSLADLDARLDGTLVFLHGPPERELPSLARRARATELHLSADSGPFARRRTERVLAAMRAAGVDCFGHPGLHAVDDLDEIHTQQGRPYTVFSPSTAPGCWNRDARCWGRRAHSARCPRASRRGDCPRSPSSGSSRRWRTRSPAARRPAANGCRASSARP